MKTIYLAALALLVTTIFSCKKGDTGPAGPAGAAGPSYTGVVEGYVGVYNQYGLRVYSGLRDIQVSMKDGATVSTDDNGHYLFSVVSTGNYTLQLSGVGLGATSVSNVSFVKDTLYSNVNMSLKPSFDVTSLTATHNAGSQYDSLVITCNADPRARNVIVFVNSGNDLSNTNYKLSYVVPMNTGGTAVLRVSAADLHAAGINSGDNVYYAAYSYVVNDMSAYVDPMTGKMVYNAVGQTPQVASTVAP